MSDGTDGRQLRLLAEIRRAWTSTAAARRARAALAAPELEADDRAWLAALLDEADAHRRVRWRGPAGWLLFFLGACTIIPPMIFLGAPHLLVRDEDRASREIEEEVERTAVYMPPPPPKEIEAEEPVLIPEEVTGPVRPTAPGNPGGIDTDGLPVMVSDFGVISARVDPSLSQPTWLQAFSGSGAGSGEGDGTGGGIPEGMIYVAGGTFPMGSPPGVGEAHERPRHPVRLSAFAIDRDEVSVGAFVRWCNGATEQCGWSFSHSSSMMADHPVTGVTWFEARAFCRSLGKDLPTEAQWEMAARYDPAADAVRAYPWGDQPPTCAEANFLGCTNLKTRPLGFSTGLSPVGARDMSGNAREWVRDRYGAYPVGRRDDPTGPPRGPSACCAAAPSAATPRTCAPPTATRRRRSAAPSTTASAARWRRRGRRRPRTPTPPRRQTEIRYCSEV